MSLKKKFLDLKEQLSKHNNSYYNATTLISDLEYDRLKSKYEKFLQENPKFVELDDLGVGAKPNSKFKKIKHISRMLSLANSFNLDDLKDFFNKAENFLNHANIVPWQQLEARIGVRVIPIPVDPSGALSLESAKTLCSKHPVAVIAVGHVSNAIGALNDVQGFVTLARENDAYSVIDGAQAAPHMMVNAKELNADFYAVSAHKCCGPTGIGVLLGRRDLLERLPPWQGGGDMIDRVSFSGTTYNELPWKFEAGTPNIADTIGFATALDYLDSIDFKGAVEHEHRVHSHLTEAMLNRDKVDVLGHPDHWVSVCSFNVKGAHPTDVGTLLDQLGIAVRTGHHCAMPTMEHFGLPGTTRASVAFYNSIEEVDRFLDALDRVIGMLAD